MEKLHCVVLTFLKLFTWGSEIVLNHQLRNVQKLIMISWHLQNRSVTNGLAAELKSFYKLRTVEAIWKHCSLIQIKITIFHHVDEEVLFGVVDWWSDGLVCYTELWGSLLSQSTSRDVSFCAILSAVSFAVGILRFLFVSLCYCKSVEKRDEKWVGERKRE